MGQPHEDLQTLYAMKGRLEETGEMAKTLGLDDGGEAGSIYQALVQVSSMVDNEIQSVRNIVGPHEDQWSLVTRAHGSGVLSGVELPLYRILGSSAGLAVLATMSTTAPMGSLDEGGQC